MGSNMKCSYKNENAFILLDDKTGPQYNEMNWNIKL